MGGLSRSCVSQRAPERGAVIPVGNPSVLWLCLHRAASARRGGGVVVASGILGTTPRSAVDAATSCLGLTGRGCPQPFTL